MITKPSLFCILLWSIVATRGEEQPTSRTALAIKRSTKKYAMSVNTSEFQDLIEKNEIFLDTTSFIRHVLNMNNSTVMVLFPHRWGKTINLNMLRAFVELHTDADGNPKNSTYSLLFKKGVFETSDGKKDSYRCPLRVARCRDLFKDYQGQYPVIHITFKNVTGDDYETLKYQIQLAISREYHRHAYVLPEIQQNPTPAAEQIANRFTRALGKDPLNETELAHSIAFLSEILHHHFNKKVFILLDDYDTPLLNFIRDKDYLTPHVDYLLNLTNDLLRGTFRKNAYMKKSVITGTSHLESFNVSKWPSYRVYDSIDSPLPMVEYFGFRQDELDVIYENLNIGNYENQMVHEWYRMPGIGVQTFYNPASIVKYLAARDIRCYIDDTIALDFIAKMIKLSHIFRENIYSLLSRSAIQRGYRWTHNYDNLVIMNRLMVATRIEDTYWRYTIKHYDILDINQTVINVAFSFLIEQGFLVTTETTADVKMVKIPNHETAYVFASKLTAYLQQLYRLDWKLLNDTSLALLDYFKSKRNDPGALQTSLRSLYQQSFIKVIPKEEIESVGPQGPVNPQYAIFSAVALNMQCLSKFQTQAFYSQYVQSNLVFVDPATKHGAVVELNHNNQTSDAALKQAQSYSHVFNKWGLNVKTVKFIGISISSEYQINISAALGENIREKKVGKDEGVTFRPNIELEGMERNVDFVSLPWSDI